MRFPDSFRVSRQFTRRLHDAIVEHGRLCCTHWIRWDWKRTSQYSGRQGANDFLKRRACLANRRVVV
jgi:hypothetical protein